MCGHVGVDGGGEHAELAVEEEEEEEAHHGRSRELDAGANL